MNAEETYKTVLGQLETLYPNATQELLEAAARNEARYLPEQYGNVVDLASRRKVR